MHGTPVASLSLGNLPNYSLAFWPLQACDLAAGIALLLACTASKRLVERLADEDGPHGSSAADYTVLLTGVPPELGVTRASERAAVAAYTRFLKGLCSTAASGRRGASRAHALLVARHEFVLQLYWY